MMATSPPAFMRPADWARLLSLALLWGGAYFLTRLSLAEVPPLTIVLARVGIAALTLWVAMAALRVPLPLNARLWGVMAVLGLINNAAPFALIAWGQQFVGTAVAAIVNGVTPLFTLVIAHFVLPGERLTARRVAGLLLGLAGVAVLVGPDALAGLGQSTIGTLALLGGALLYGFAIVYARVHSGAHPALLSAGQMTFATLMIAPLAIAIDQPWTLTPSLPVLGALALLGIASSGMGYLLYFRLIRDVGASNASLVTLLNPIFAALLALIFLLEWPRATAWAGFALIAVGLLVVDGRVLRVLRSG